LAKKKHSNAPEFVEEFEGAADRLANWVAAHAWQVGGGLLALLLAVGGFQAFRDASRQSEEAASNALDEVRSGYLLALGAAPGALELPELANPAAAEEIREEYLVKFQTIADDHGGTLAGTLALFEVAALTDDLGRGEQTAAVWEEALRRSSENPRLRGMLHQRIASAHEEDEAWSQAATAHEAAGAIAGYPLRYWAQLDAARCWLMAGEQERALELFDAVETEAPDLQLPDHLRMQRNELRAARAETTLASATPPSDTAPDAPGAAPEPTSAGTLPAAASPEPGTAEPEPSATAARPAAAANVGSEDPAAARD